MWTGVRVVKEAQVRHKRASCLHFFDAYAAATRFKLHLLSNRHSGPVSFKEGGQPNKRWGVRGVLHSHVSTQVQTLTAETSMQVPAKRAKGGPRARALDAPELVPFLPGRLNSPQGRVIQTDSSH